MIKNNLSKIMGEKRIKMSEIYRITGLGKNTLFRIYHNQTNTISFNTIDKLCWALQCKVGDLFEYYEE